ncbi:MAG TPA: hypothetical protein VJ932_05710 [Alkalispirochaeta sp.]|nr:hypothetical protein [Alkalispirochaeta sp.]
MRNHTPTLLTPLLLIALVILIVPAAFTQELTWSGSVNGTGSGRFADHLEETDWAGSVTTALTVQAFAPIGTDSTIELVARPSYTWSDDRLYLFDVERLSADVQIPNIVGTGTVLRGQFGRFRLTTPAARLFSEPVDGLNTSLSVSGLRLQAGAGYTGLILNPVSTVRVTPADEADGSDDDEFFGPRRIVAFGELTVPEVALRQTVRLYAIGQWDLRDAESDEISLDSYYGGAAVDGPIMPGLFHDVGATVSYADVEGTTSLGLLATARLRYFRSDWNSSRIALGGGTATGLGGESDAFIGISDRTVGTVAQLPQSNIAYGELSYGLRPLAGAPRRTLRDIQTTITGRMMYRVDTDRPVDAFGAAEDSSGALLGTEAVAQVGWRATSDLGVSVDGGAFFPASGSSGSFSDERDPEYLLRMQVSASF